MKLWGWRSKKEKNVSVLKIGVWGTARGVGNTHFAIMLGNYYSNGCGKRTCVIEYNNHRDFLRIYKECQPDKGDMKRYSLGGIDFIMCDNPEAIAEYMSGKYEVVIMDMTSEKHNALSEMKRCDLRIIIGSTSQWKVGALREMLEKIKNMDKVLAVFTGDDKYSKKLAKEYGAGYFHIPTEYNPLAIKPKTLYVFSEFFGKL